MVKVDRPRKATETAFLMGKKPSQEFIDAICDSGAPVVTCDLCGKTIFATRNIGIYNQYDLDNLRSKAKKDPFHYSEWHTYDDVSFGYFNGRTAVPGCSDECDEKIAKYEEFVIAHRFIIAKYLNKRAVYIVREAVEDAKMSEIKDKDRLIKEEENRAQGVRAGLSGYLRPGYDGED